MKLKQLEHNAIAFFESGYNCAEAVSQAIIEAFSDATPEDIPRVASAFGGGIGGSREEACGALTGGIIAIGLIMGRSLPQEDNTAAKEAAKAYREKFQQLSGATQCGALLEKFGDQENYHECGKLVGQATVALARIFKEAGLKYVK